VGRRKRQKNRKWRIWRKDRRRQQLKGRKNTEITEIGGRVEWPVMHITLLLKIKPKSRHGNGKYRLMYTF
jgi:hypothetical protein